MITVHVFMVYGTVLLYISGHYLDMKDRQMYWNLLKKEVRLSVH